MKKISIFLSAGLVLLLTVYGCSKDEEKDNLKPVIDMDFTDAFPKPCDTLHRGENFVFRGFFSDNAELGNFNLELHHNFDHHTHGSHVEACEFDPVKVPVNPFYHNESYSIPAGSLTFDALIEIPVPADVDKGDYHFMVKLTDKEGWQSWKSVSVKIK